MKKNTHWKFSLKAYLYETKGSNHRFQVLEKGWFKNYQDYKSENRKQEV